MDGGNVLLSNVKDIFGEMNSPMNSVVHEAFTW